MPPNIPADLLSRARQIILPLVGTEDEREALLTDAFYLLPDSRLYYQIKRDGTPMSFTTLCIRTLIDYGCVTDDTHALGQLLNTTQMYCGKDKHAEIEALTAIANTICTDPPPRVADDVKSAPVVADSARVQTIATPADERRPTVFISYSHADDAFAQKLIADLNAAGHACWIDTARIKSGDEWVRSITEGIKNSYAFISIVSETANESTWVRREFLWAEYKNKLIFPVMAQECELVIYLMERQMVFMHTDYEAGLAQLLAGLPEPVAAPADEGDDDTAVDGILRSEKTPVNRRRLELDYLEQLRAEALFDLEKYTPLGGESQFVVNMRRGEEVELARMRPEFEHFMRDDERTETRRFDNAVDENPDDQTRCPSGRAGRWQDHDVPEPCRKTGG